MSLPAARIKPSGNGSQRAAALHRACEHALGGRDASRVRYAAGALGGCTGPEALSTHARPHVCCAAEPARAPRADAGGPCPVWKPATPLTLAWPHASPPAPVHCCLPFPAVSDNELLVWTGGRSAEVLPGGQARHRCPASREVRTLHLYMKCHALLVLHRAEVFCLVAMQNLIPSCRE